MTRTIKQIKDFLAHFCLVVLLTLVIAGVRWRNSMDDVVLLASQSSNHEGCAICRHQFMERSTNNGSNHMILE